ncbi:MAG: hypothetical protein H6843_03490 [Rhodospirillaceae bacterium]|nr:hypothetical protein [Rhodospirillaceae bacterium]
MSDENGMRETRDLYGPYHLALQPEVISGYLIEAHRQRAACACAMLAAIGHGIGAGARWLWRGVTHAVPAHHHHSVTAHH